MSEHRSVLALLFFHLLDLLPIQISATIGTDFHRWMLPMTDLQPTSLTKLKRAPDRGSYDLSVIENILDSTPLCHVGYQVDGQTIVMPTIHWRMGSYIYWHGSRLSQTMVAPEAAPVCVTVTHLDGLVLARSAFHHSANYRSVLVFGKPELLIDPAEKTEALKVMINKLMPNRWQSLRAMTTKELNATAVLRLKLEAASAKIRQGGPNDLETDQNVPVWAGVLPLSTKTGEPEPCPYNQPGQPEPEGLRNFGIG